MKGSFHVNFLTVMVAVFTVIQTGRAEIPREWESNDGKKLDASLVRHDDEAVVLRLTNNREVSVPIERLSQADREFLRDLSAGLVARLGKIRPLPEETGLPGEIEVTGGPQTFFTRHFQFTTDRDVSRYFISEAAKIYEGTYEAIKSLPHGLPLSPPEGETHFRGRLMENAAFQARVSALKGEENSPTGGIFVGIPPSSRTRTVGIYVPKEKSLLVPYESLGAKTNGSRLTLRKSSDTSTLVHEIAHQVMHDWLPFVPVWFAEGMAEYIAAIPSQNGRFEFRNAERGLKNRLKEKYAAESYTVSGVRRLSQRVEVKAVSKEGDTENSSRGAVQGLQNPGNAPVSPPGGSWSGSMDDYRDAMLHLYFLIHLMEPEQPGIQIGKYLQAVESGRASSSQIQGDIAEYEKRRKKFNEEVEVYNAAVTKFRKQVDAYNAKVKEHNSQIAEGVPEDQRVEVGEIPEEPTPPGELEVPGSLKDLSFDRPVDLRELVWKETAEMITGGIDGEALDQSMVDSFQSIGIRISFR